MGGTLYVTEKFIKQLHANDKTAARANLIPGLPRYVLPTTNYEAFDANAFVRNHRGSVYDTMDLALAAVTDGRGDAMILLPGGHVPTASLVMDKAGLSVWGMEAWMGYKVRKPSAVVTGPGTGDGMAITVPDVSFHGITCVPVTAKNWATFDGGADGLTVRNCYFDLATPVVNIATQGFTGSAAIEDLSWHGNTAWSDGAQGPVLEITGANLNCLIDWNHYHVDAGTWAVAVSLISPDGIRVEHDVATCGGTAMTACFDGSGTTVIAGVVFKDCRKGVLVTLFVDGFGTTTHAELVGNHTATIGAGTGETLITVIT